MKKLSAFVIVLAFIAFFSSCKKDNNPGCHPSNIPCPPGPFFGAMETVPDGLQDGHYVYDVYLAIVNPGPDNTGKVDFYLNGVYEEIDSPLIHTNAGDAPAVAHITIAVLEDTFTMTGKGYATPIRCDCPPNINSYSYSPFVQGNMKQGSSNVKIYGADKKMVETIKAIDLKNTLIPIKELYPRRE